MNHEVVLARRRELRVQPSDAEALLWSHLRGRRLGGYKFRRQHACGPFNLDFFCPERRLAIEIDQGRDFHPDARRRDRRRAEELASRGISVLRFAAHQVLSQTDAVLATIAFALV
ncbi:MAG TPA: endonuclease domain-containing protein [Polyangia bacterium]|nr:endonuclease domain-containing protein [Polyangia bacterium]